MAQRIKDLEHRLEQTEQELRLLQKISRYMARDRELADALPQIVNAIVTLLQSDSCLLYLLEEGQLVLTASSPAAANAIGRIALQVNEGLTGWVAREKRLLAISREAYLDPRFKFFSDLPEDTFEAFLSAPVICRNKVIGVINVQHRGPHSHTGSEMELLTSIGEQIGALVSLQTRHTAEPELQLTGPTTR